MQLRVLILAAMLLGMPAIAAGSTLTAPGNFPLLANTAGQVVSLSLTGTDAYTDAVFSGTIAAGGPLVTAIFATAAPPGAIPTANLDGSIWANGFGLTNSYGLTPGAAFSTENSASQTTAGIFIVLTLDTTGIDAGTYAFDISATVLNNGLNLDTFQPIPSANFATENGSFVIGGVPEPSSVVLGLFAVAGLAAVAIRRRRTA